MTRSLLLQVAIVLVPFLRTAGGEEAWFRAPPPREVQNFTRTFCLDCHSGPKPQAKVDLESLEAIALAERVETWEKVLRKLRSRQMPPAETQRPSETEYETVVELLGGQLDRLADNRPRPGRTTTLRRLTRFEYQNAIRDLLGLEIDAVELLPKDESSQGFDNITVGELSPTLMNRYIAAAERISGLAVGSARLGAGGRTIRIRPDITQERHIAGLPLGTRGGELISHTFPQTGQYEIRIRLARDRNEHVEGLRGSHELEVSLDRRRVALFSVTAPRDPQGHAKADSHLFARIRVHAGRHNLGVAFLAQSGSLLETLRQPYQASFNMHRHPRSAPAIYQVTVTGPFDAQGPGDTESRRKIFTTYPKRDQDQEACAKEIVHNLARRAWRRPVSDDDLRRPMAFFHRGQEDGGFDAGIETALASILVNPQFLFRIERDPHDVQPGQPYPVSSVELASRLSFFLWSSLPDATLLELAERGELHRPEILEQQVRRMLADDRAEALATNFAGQWLHLRNLDAAYPDMRRFPDFDHNLREAMKRETELFFAHIVREDRNVLELLQADYTFVNERLARHYGMPHIQGTRFRRVDLPPESHRGGLLRHSSILTVTSYATRTSPVLRGQWILKNLLGSPPPPPPADVPDLKENTVDSNLSVRDRLAQHRADSACASCHNLMDPAGLALENFDAIGRWRTRENGTPIDSTGGLPDGSEFQGVVGLEDALRRRPELFVGTLTEKLMTFALGRGITANDAPAVRHIIREAADDSFRFSSLVIGIVRSKPFLMREPK